MQLVRLTNPNPTAAACLPVCQAVLTQRCDSLQLQLRQQADLLGATKERHAKEVLALKEQVRTFACVKGQAPQKRVVACVFFKADQFR